MMKVTVTCIYLQNNLLSCNVMLVVKSSSSLILSVLIKMFIDVLIF